MDRPPQSDDRGRGARGAAPRHRHPDTRGDGGDRGLLAPLQRERRALHDREPARRRPRADAAERAGHLHPDRRPPRHASAMPSRASSAPSSSRRRRRIPTCKNADCVFIALLEAIIDRTADILEKVGADIDAISAAIFQSETARAGDRARLQGHAAPARPQRRPQFEGAREPGQHRPAGEFPDRRMRRHASGPARAHARRWPPTSARSPTTPPMSRAPPCSCSTRSLGLINIEQNDIIKIVSVVSVLIMPPTLIASIYGMNFRFMPELELAVRLSAGARRHGRRGDRFPTGISSGAAGSEAAASRAFAVARTDFAAQHARFERDSGRCENRVAVDFLPQSVLT